MTSDEIARDYLRRVQGRREALRVLLERQLHADVVRESQEIVELALKGALRFVGVDPPKRHDTHKVLARFLDRFPAEWRVAMQDLEAQLGELSEKRAAAFYGDDVGLIPASVLFSETDARRALAVVDRLVALYERLLRKE